MHRNYTNAAKHYQKQHRWNSIWKKVTMALASVVVFATTYALILPAITMEPEYICGKEAHLHSEACYQLPEVSTVSSLVCTPNALGVHEHTTECCDENGKPKCGIADFVLHTHNSDCFDANGELVCSLPEIKAHTHDASCWQQPHVHLDTCYIQQRGELVCTLEEGSVHTHLDTCYTQQENLICTLSEAEPHTHTTEACYEESKTLLCAEPEVEPHTHSDSCYTLETTKTCSLEETEGHLHTADCFAEDGTTKICTLPEVVGHAHTDACFQTTSVFTCTLTETAGHTHSDTCYSEPVYTLTCKEEETAGHTHSSTCRETVSVLTCAIDENIPHAHTDACFICTPVLQCKELTAKEGAVPVLICEEEELIPHTHEAACFDESGACICGLLQISEHVHGDTCFVITQEQAAEPVLTCGYEVHEHGEACIAKAEADNTITTDQLIAEGYYCGTVAHIHATENGCFDENGSLLCTMTEHKHTWQCQLNLPAQDTSDIETADDWEADLPALTGEIAADLIAVAESQLGYQQSAVNYIIGDEEVLYYSRYADWWGSDPYGDWTAKFVSFCLDYADITDVPLNADAAEWPEMLADYDQWHENDGEFQPIPADLVFFDDKEDGVADRVGIVAEVDTANGQLTVILEHRGMVQQITYDLDGGDILGYARIPGNEPALELLNMSNVQNVINLIDQMPSAEEIDAVLMAYEDAGDLSGQDEYFLEVSEQVCAVYTQYSMLSEEEKASVTNAGKLLELEYMWGNQAEASTYASSYATEITGYNLEANNILPIDAYLGIEAAYRYDGTTSGTYNSAAKNILDKANVIYVDLPVNAEGARCNLGNYLLGKNHANLLTAGGVQGPYGVDLNAEWCALRVEKAATEYPGYIVQQVVYKDSDVTRIGKLSVTTDAGFILLIRSSLIEENDLYIPGEGEAYLHLNKELLDKIKGWPSFEFDPGYLPSNHSSNASYVTLAYATLSPVAEYDANGKRIGDAGARADDMKVVDDIKFKLFDYSNYINKVDRTDVDSAAAGEIHEKYRALAKYFYFRGGFVSDRDYSLDVAKYTPNVNTVSQDGAGHSIYDQDGYTVNHARVEPNLWNGYPILDFTVDAKGNAVTPPTDEHNNVWTTGKMLQARSLRFLFDQNYAETNNWTAPHKVATGAVTEYSPTNTILQFNEDTHTYWYDSAQNAVDYDIDEQEFRVRKYTERTSITADWPFDDSAGSGDFLPFNYSNGIVNATYHSGSQPGVKPVADSSFRMNDVNYWFGMSMEFDFIQGENGTVTYTNNKGETKTDVMEFEFSGDDDVWVFVDGVRILDLGGTHGSVTGTINFQTGKVTQKLTWGEDPNKSYPTTLKDCFELADKTPNGGWDTDNSERFADYSTHTLQFFYLERGTAVANCSIRFNLPNFQNPLVVGKTLEAADADVNADALEYLQENTEYSYRVVKADANGNPTSELLIEPGRLYTVLDNGLNIGTYTVGADGFFKLKHGQQAIFENIWEIAGEAPVNFVVEEMLPETQTGHYNSVSYTLSAQEGTITDKTDNSVERFVGYYSPTLTSTKSTQIQFRNVVDTDTLSVLKVTKVVAEGSDLAEDQAYTIRVKLDGEYVAEGTKYSIDGTEYAVGKNGSITLTGGQTAEFLIPVLAGTTYEVLEDAKSGWVVTYTGIVTDSEGNQTTADLMDGVADTFPMDGTVHVTITNSTYACRVPLRFTKQAVGNSREADFTFQITQVNENGEEVTEQTGVWPAQPTIHVSDTTPADTTIYFVYGSTVADGTYYYRLTETPTDGWSCDDSEYIVAIKVEDGAAQIDSVTKDGENYGMDTEPLFVNYKDTSITVDKTVTGNREEANLSKEFSFTAVVTLNDEPVIPADGEGYTVETDGTVSFKLTDGGAVTITGIPFGAQVTVTEANAPGFSPYYKLNDGSNNYESNSATVIIDKTLYEIHFYNSGGYELPETGGPGTSLFAGAILMIFPLLCIVCRKGYKGRRVTGG